MCWCAAVPCWRMSRRCERGRAAADLSNTSLMISQLFPTFLPSSLQTAADGTPPPDAVFICHGKAVNSALCCLMSLGEACVTLEISAFGCRAALLSSSQCSEDCRWVWFVHFLHIICCVYSVFRCSGCVNSRWKCNWCIHQHVCTHRSTCDIGDIIYNQHVSFGFYVGVVWFALWL